MVEYPDLTYRYRGELFTGIGCEETNGVMSEIQYVMGRQQGVARDWTSTGQLLAEAHYYDSTLHGWDRRFDSRGQVTEERLFEYGIVTRRNQHNSERTFTWTIAEGDGGSAFPDGTQWLVGDRLYRVERLRRRDASATSGCPCSRSRGYSSGCMGHTRSAGRLVDA
jgi:hypothetical protein